MRNSNLYTDYITLLYEICRTIANQCFISLKMSNTDTTLSAPLKRITILDALRGFALLGVILIHMIQRFGIRSMDVQESLHFPVLDDTVQWIGSNIIMGRFINIFAFLFGMSFFIQMDRAKKKGVDFRGRFVWRMFLLLFLGLLTHSFFNLEIISIYAIFGVLLIPLYQVKNKMLLVLVGFLLLGGPRIIQSTIHNSSLAQQEQTTAQESIDTQRTREIPDHIANPSFYNTAVNNYKERLPGKLNYQFGYIGRGYVTLALFILGLIVGRSRFFESIYEQRKLHLKLFVGFLIGVLLALLTESLIPEQNMFLFFRPDGEHIPSLLILSRTLADVEMVLFTGMLVTGFILLYQQKQFTRYLDVLSPYGRTALTNYILQGVIGCLLFAPWAFGKVFGGWGVAVLFLLGICIYILQIILSKLWLKKYLYGPLEWLWRSGTYLKLQPFRKNEQV